MRIKRAKVSLFYGVRCRMRIGRWAFQLLAREPRARGFLRSGAFPRKSVLVWKGREVVLPRGRTQKNSQFLFRVNPDVKSWVVLRIDRSPARKAFLHCLITPAARRCRRDGASSSIFPRILTSRLSLGRGKRNGKPRNHRRDFRKHVLAALTNNEFELVGDPLVGARHFP